MINLHEQPQVDILWGRLFTRVLLNVLPFDVYPLKTIKIATKRVKLHNHFQINSITNKMTEIAADNFHRSTICSRYSPYWGTKRLYEGTVLWEINHQPRFRCDIFPLFSLKQIDIQVTRPPCQWHLHHLHACRWRATSLKWTGITFNTFYFTFLFIFSLIWLFHNEHQICNI